MRFPRRIAARLIPVVLLAAIALPAHAAPDGSPPNADAATAEESARTGQEAGTEQSDGGIPPENPPADEPASAEGAELTEDPGQGAAGTAEDRPPRKELAIPLRDHPLVHKYMEEYQRPFGVRWLKGVLEAAAPYRIYVRQQLEKHGLPACLEYLPVIESEYRTDAKSRSGALGVWQFMENSIAPFLEKSDWVDERLDPWKSTDAAIRKLQDNFSWFNDWELALAAYNYGAGGISRTIKRNGGTSDYWQLVDLGALTKQTEAYVPKFLAVAELVTNEAHYGLEFPKASDKDLLKWDEVAVAKSVPLAALANEMGIDVSILRYLNPSLLRGRTPPATEYLLRVPAGTGAEVRELVKSIQLPAYEHTYTVVKGDTLWGISRRYGITVQDLCDANDINENGILSIGKVLYVPIIE